MTAPRPLDELIADHAEQFSARLLAKARTATKEEQIRIEAERQLAFVEQAAGITLQGQHEFTLASGRVDSVYDRVLIEYKNPSSSSARIGPHLTSPGTKAVVQQIQARFGAMLKEHNQPLTSLLGIGLDGTRLIFVRYRAGAWDIEPPVSLTRASAERFLWALFNLGTRGKPFSPDYLAEDFGADSTIAKDGIRTLYEAALATSDPKATTLFSQWRLLFSEVCGYDVNTPSDKLRALASAYSIPHSGLKPAALFFALHTYYALFMKLLASELIAFAHHLPGPLRRIQNASTSAALKSEVLDLEAGSIFRHFNISNFLEGDLFSWYTAAWSPAMERLVRNLVSTLDGYNPGTLSEDPVRSRDLLKQLYQRLFPKAVRHDLGEYYTPDWLAEHVLDRANFQGDPRKRVLDPACGSGTFLVAAINRARAYYLKERERLRLTEAELGRLLTQNIVGFDLNPLAVMAARTNYLIALRDLLTPMGGIEIPVYLCDSILRPTEHADLFSGPIGATLELKTAAGAFVIPTEVALDGATVAGYVEQLEFCLKNAYSPSEFIQRMRDAGLPAELHEKHATLYSHLLALDRAGRNGVWARIIKNSFAPLFAGRFDFVVGNPPWVNWEHLPEQYREDTEAVWVHYKLLGASPTGKRQASDRSKTDVSILMLNVAADVFLKERGLLAFVITQTVFQSELGGRNFRRFTLPDGTALGCTEVDDMSALQPFEGATNRTSTLVIKRGQATTYPVPYSVWAKKVRGAIAQSASLSQVRELTVRQDWVAAHVATTDALSSWFVGPEAGVTSIRSLLGPSVYSSQVREGANTRGANGVYYLDVKATRPDALVVTNLPELGRRATRAVTAQVEPTYLYPVARGREVRRWVVAPSLVWLMPHDRVAPTNPVPESKLKREARRTYAFLKQFESELRSRKKFRNFDPSVGAFYGLYNVGDYTFADHRVVWREQATDFICAPIGPVTSELLRDKPILVNHKLMQVAVASWDEALYLSGMLNSSIARYIVISYTVGTQISTHVLDNVPVPRFSSTEPSHRALVVLARAAVKAATSNSDELRAIEERVDSAAAAIFGCPTSRLKAINSALAQVLDLRAVASVELEEDE